MSDSARHFIRLLDELARTRGRTAIAFRDIRIEHGLTEVENIVLTAVTGAERLSTVPQIGRSLGHPRQVIQRAADALIDRHLVDWSENPDHKRARLLIPTAEGSRLRRIADVAGLARAAELTAAIDPRLIETTVDGLHAIRVAIEAGLRLTGDAGR